VSIQWFPGHMHRARKTIRAAMARVDVVLELLDARLPRSSENPMLEEIRGGTPKLRVLAKADLADPETTRAWIARYERKGGAVGLACDDARAVRRLARRCLDMAPGRGTALKPVRAMVVGIPNVGKSTLLNTLKGRRVARVANVPAVTRGPQRVDVDEGLVVSDTPGVLWPKLDDQEAALRLGATGAIRDSALDPESVALFAAGFLAQRYPERLAERYGIEPDAGSPAAVLEAIGRRRGCLLPRAEVDVPKAASLLLRELRDGKLGRVSLEAPPGG